MKTGVEEISKRDGTSLNQFLVVAAAEKIAAMETEERFFAERKGRADRKAFRRILDRKRRAAPPRGRDRLRAYPKMGTAGLQAGCRAGLLTRTSLLAAWTPPVQPVWRPAVPEGHRGSSPG